MTLGATAWSCSSSLVVVSSVVVSVMASPPRACLLLLACFCLLASAYGMYLPARADQRSTPPDDLWLAVRVDGVQLGVDVLAGHVRVLAAQRRPVALAGLAHHQRVGAAHLPPQARGDARHTTRDGAVGHRGGHLPCRRDLLLASLPGLPLGLQGLGQGFRCV